MYFNEATVVFADGEYKKVNDVSVNPYNQTMHYGSGAFEGIRSYDTPDGTRIFKAIEHYDRLKYSCDKMYIPFEYTSDDLEQITYKLLELNNLKNAYIRPLVYTAPNMSLTACESSHLIIMVWEWGKYLGNEQLHVVTSSFERPNPKSCFVDAKITGHYTNSILATQEAKTKGYDEALLTDMKGNVAEGPGANFFYEKNGELFTCPKGNILPGITRQTVFEIAEELNIPVHEKWFGIEEVYKADAAFFCGTAAEIAGIKSLDDKIFPMQWEDSISHMIQRKYKLRVSTNEFNDMLI